MHVTSQRSECQRNLHIMRKEAGKVPEHTGILGFTCLAVLSESLLNIHSVKRAGAAWERAKTRFLPSQSLQPWGRGAEKEGETNKEATPCV